MCARTRGKMFCWERLCARVASRPVFRLKLSFYLFLRSSKQRLTSRSMKVNLNYITIIQFMLFRVAANARSNSLRRRCRNRVWNDGWMLEDVYVVQWDWDASHLRKSRSIKTNCLLCESAFVLQADITSQRYKIYVFLLNVVDSHPEYHRTIRSYRLQA